MSATTYMEALTPVSHNKIKTQPPHLSKAQSGISSAPILFHMRHFCLCNHRCHSTGTCRHPNLLPLLGVMMTEDPSRFVMVSEWMENRNFNTIVKAHPDASCRLRLVCFSPPWSALASPEINHHMITAGSSWRFHWGGDPYVPILSALEKVCYQRTMSFRHHLSMQRLSYPLTNSSQQSGHPGPRSPAASLHEDFQSEDIDIKPITAYQPEQLNTPTTPPLLIRSSTIPMIQLLITAFATFLPPTPRIVTRRTSSLDEMTPSAENDTLTSLRPEYFTTLDKPTSEMILNTPSYPPNSLDEEAAQANHVGESDCVPHLIRQESLTGCGSVPLGGSSAKQSKFLTSLHGVTL